MFCASKGKLRVRTPAVFILWRPRQEIWRHWEQKIKSGNLRWLLWRPKIVQALVWLKKTLTKSVKNGIKRFFPVEVDFLKRLFCSIRFWSFFFWTFTTISDGALLFVAARCVWVRACVWACLPVWERERVLTSRRACEWEVVVPSSWWWRW